MRICCCIFLMLATVSLQADDQGLCWKQSFGRGVGGIGNACPSGKVMENGLCYSTCAAGYVGNGPLCWQACPSGFSDMGVSCTKPAPTSSAGYPWKFGDTAFDFDTGPRSRCEADNGAGNCYRSGAIWYPKCKANFHKVGDLICTPDCPSGMRDDGAFCAKQTQTRGVGAIPGCGAGLDADAGLCYPSCGQGFSGVGPVCWGTCPAEYPAQCGAACAKSAAACGVAVGDMVLNTVGVAINVLSFAFGGPGITSSIKAAAEAGENAAAQSVIKYTSETLSQGLSTAAKEYAKSFGAQFVKTTLKNQLNPRNLFWTVTSLSKTGSLKAMNKAATEFGVLKESNTFDLSMLTALDPTGISSMILSFTKYGSRSGDDFMVDTKEIDFGNIGAGTGQKTFRITAQQPMTVTRITSPAFSNCSINAEADCIGKQLSVGQTCDIKLTTQGTGGLDSEARIYTDSFSVIPYAIHVKSNTGAAPCADVPNVDEAVNLTSISGAWAFDSNQAHKVVVQSNGTVQGWVGNGTVTVKNAAQRSFEFKFGSFGPATLVLNDTSDQLTGSTTAIKRPWDSHCNAGGVFLAGLCYDVPPGYALTAPGFMGKPCPADWRDDGTSCYPPWTGVAVAAQADKDSSTFTMRHPIIVTDCVNYSALKGQTCPANFFNSAGPAGCSCQPKTTSKEVKSIIGTSPTH